MKSYEVWLPYFKQGSDLYRHIESSETLEKGLRSHALAMKAAEEQLSGIADIVKDYSSAHIDADTHMIRISGPQEMLDRLLAEDLINVVNYEDDEECWEEE